MSYLQYFKPRTPSLRHKVGVIRVDFLKNQKHFSLLTPKSSFSGRNNSGRITVRHRSGSWKNKRLVIVDRLRLKIILAALLVGIFKQKSNMSFFGLIKYSNGAYSYIPLAHEVKLNTLIKESSFLTKRAKLPLGSLEYFLSRHVTHRFFNLCSLNKKRSIYARAAGTFCTFIKKNVEKNILKIILPSGQYKILTADYYATVGRASNIFAYKLVPGKAGSNRRGGIRPTVRGVAMNPIDHPNGGRTKTNQPEKNPWGKIARKSK